MNSNCKDIRISICDDLVNEINEMKAPGYEEECDIAKKLLGEFLELDIVKGYLNLKYPSKYRIFGLSLLNWPTNIDKLASS